MSKVNDGGPAFAHGNHEQGGHSGMSLRDWFAGQIASGMAAFSGTSGVPYSAGNIAVRSYEVADALLAARSLPEEGR